MLHLGRSGAAVAGGLLLDRTGFAGTFLITAAVQVGRPAPPVVMLRSQAWLDTMSWDEQGGLRAMDFVHCPLMVKHGTSVLC